MAKVIDVSLSRTLHSFEWVARVGAGRHVIRLYIQNGNSTQVANIGPYTTSVEVLE